MAGVLALAPFAVGAVVLRLDGRLVGRPDRYSLQVGARAHLLPGPEVPWRYLNHHCDPNLAVDVGRRVLVARRPIAAGDELVFDYNTTEWAMAEPFACRCGAAACYGRVQGFRALSPRQQAALLPDAAPHLAALLHAAVPSP